MSADVTDKLTPIEPELQGQITPTAIVAGVIVAAIMGASYPYMVMKLGFGPNVSVVAAFFGFILLTGADLLFRRRDYSRWQNNIVEAAGTSAAQTAFMCVLLGAFDLLNASDSTKFRIELPWYTSFLWLTAACSLGVLMAVPLRRHFVVDEKLPFVDGLSTGETSIVLDPPRNASAEIKRNAYAAAKAVMAGDPVRLAHAVPRGRQADGADHRLGRPARRQGSPVIGRRQRDRQ